MSISLKTEWLQRTQLMTGVNRRRIWRVLRDIKYYKINTGNSVLIRGKKSKKKKKKKNGMSQSGDRIFFSHITNMYEGLSKITWTFPIT